MVSETVDLNQEKTITQHYCDWITTNLQRKQQTIASFQVLKGKPTRLMIKKKQQLRFETVTWYLLL